MRPLDPRLLRHARASRTYLVVCVGLGAASAGLIVAQATLIAHAIARLFPTPHRTPLGGTLAALAVVIAARATVGWAQEVAAHRAAAAVKFELRTRLLATVTKLGPGWLTGQRSGELAALTGHGLDALDAYFARYLPQLVLSGLVPVIVLARIFPADLVAAGTIVVTIPLIPVFMILIGLHTQQANRKQFHLLTRLSHHFLDVVAGLPTLKAFRRTAAQEMSIRKVTDTYRKVTMRTLRIAFLSSFALELLSTLSVAMVAVGIGLRLVNGELGFEPHCWSWCWPPRCTFPSALSVRTSMPPRKDSPPRRRSSPCWRPRCPRPGRTLRSRTSPRCRCGCPGSPCGTRIGPRPRWRRSI